MGGEGCEQETTSCCVVLRWNEEKRRGGGYSKEVYVDGKGMRQFKAEDGQKTEDVTSECMRWEGKSQMKRNFRRYKPCRRQGQKSTTKRGRKKRREEGVSIIGVSKSE